MGRSTLSGSTITNTGMKDNDHMHISEDFVTGPGVKDLEAGEGLVTQSATLGRKVKVAKGRFYISNRNWTPNQNSNTRFWRDVVDADEDGGVNLTTSPNTTLPTRVDLVCVRINPGASPGDDGENSASFYIIEGTVNATVPSIPNDGYSYEILARLDLPQNYTDVLNSYITDLRVKATILGDDWRVIEKSNDPNFVGTNLAVVQYVSTNSIKIYGDWRNKIGVNYRLKFVNGGSTKYFIVTDSGNFSGGYTTYTVSGGGIYTLANSPILCAYYSSLSQPIGYPALALPNRTGWIPAEEAWTFNSYDATVRTGVLNATGASSKYAVGMRIKFSQPTGGLKFAIITALSSTTITFFLPSGVDFDNEPISNNFFSAQKIPLGFDINPDSWTLSVTDSSPRLGTAPKGVWYRPTGSTASLHVPIGAWELSAMTLSRSAVTGVAVYVTTGISISASTNSVTSEDLTVRGEYAVGGGGSVINLNLTQTPRGNVFLNSKTQYYLLHFMNSDGTSGSTSGFNSPATIKATCLYL